MHAAKIRRVPCCRGLSRVVTAIAAAGATVLLLAAPALAHITVTPGSAPAGSAAILTFHVPDEEATSSTTKVDMKIPTDHPIVNLLVQPVPGWTISVRTITLAKPVVTDDGRFTQAVSEIIWAGGRIAPGQFQDFSVSADPLPTGVRSLAFKALQTYANGDVVRWIDLPVGGQPGPGHPAPVLTLTSGTHPARTTAAADAPAAPRAGADGTARALAIAGLAAGVLGLAAAAAGLRRRRVSGG
jgi:uncharacterized protein YcnI